MSPIGSDPTPGGVDRTARPREDASRVARRGRAHPATEGITMTTRREFLEWGAGALAGVAFVGCDWLAAAPARAQGPRREVMLAGRRVKTVDVHAHCAVPEALALMNLKLLAPGTSWPPVLHMATQVSERLRAMDEQGIDVQALSINPYWYKAERELATQLIQIQNEKLAEACAAHPDRFVAFASVALQHPDLAAQQLEDGVKKHGLRGAAIGGSVNGEEISDPKFHPFWAKVEELGALVFIHPQGAGVVADIPRRLKGNGYLENVIGNPLETTIALSHLIFEGTLDRFPGVKICAAHAGGYLPSYAGRSDHGCSTRPSACPGGPHGPIKKKPSEYLKQMYYDTLVFSPEGVRHLAAEVGASQLVVGTDFPYPWTRTAVDLVLETPGLSDADRAAVLGGTAMALLGIKP
jgi:aminocarboxymuconate-semialdehyde decarboxylase